MVAVILILAAASITSGTATSVSVSVSRVCLDAAENLSSALDDLARDFTKKGGATEEVAAGSLLRPETPAKRAHQMADRLHQRIERWAIFCKYNFKTGTIFVLSHRYNYALDLNVRAIDDALSSTNDTAFAALKSCCSVSAETLSYSAKFGTSIDSSGPCSVNDLGRVRSSFSNAVAGSFRRNLLGMGAPSGLKWQYYIPEEERGGQEERLPHLEFPTARLSCGLAGDARHKRQYFQTAARRPRAVVIAFDRGSAMTERQLDLSRAVVRYVLATISDRDLIGLVAVAGGSGGSGVYSPLQPTPRDCLLKSLVPASVEAVLRLSKFVNVVQRSEDDGVTDHEAALSAIVEMARNTRGVDGDVKVLYLTNGDHLPADLPDVLNGSNIVVDGYLLNADEQKGSNLGKLATQTGGQLKIIDSTQDMAFKIGNYFGVSSGGTVKSHETFVFSPSWDPVGGWTVFSLTQSVPNGGVAGIDVHAAELLEDLIYFDEDAGGTYPILAERVGSKFEVVYHPSTFGVDSPTVGTLLEELEGDKFGSLELREIASHQSGRKMVQGGDIAIDWKWVDGTSYTAIIVTRKEKNAGTSKNGADSESIPKPAAVDLLYHSSKNADTCRYFDSATNVEHSTLYLGPEAFEWPSRHLRDPAFAVNVSGFFNRKCFIL